MGIRVISGLKFQRFTNSPVSRFAVQNCTNCMNYNACNSWLTMKTFLKLGLLYVTTLFFVCQIRPKASRIQFCQQKSFGVFYFTEEIMNN